MDTVEGIDFRFFLKIDMYGPYLANIGKQNMLNKKQTKNVKSFA